MSSKFGSFFNKIVTKIESGIDKIEEKFEGKPK